jgi:NAD(P)H-nitrite reductase large subunit
MLTQSQAADRMICHCLQVKQSTVADSVAIYGATCVKDVIRTCGAGGGCNSCHVKIKQLIELHGTIESNAQPQGACC